MIKANGTKEKENSTMIKTPTASTKYLKEAIEQAKNKERIQHEKAFAIIQEILNEDEAIKNKKHIKRIK